MYRAHLLLCLSMTDAKSSMDCVIALSTSSLPSPIYLPSHNEGLQLLIPAAEQGLRRHLSVVVRQKRYVPSPVRLPL